MSDVKPKNSGSLMKKDLTDTPLSRRQLAKVKKENKKNKENNLDTQTHLTMTRFVS